MESVLDEIEVFNVNLPIEEASTPPASWYISPEIFELEKKRIFLKNWLCVGRVDQLQRSGSFFSGEHTGEPFFVVKDTDGAIRAFYNVCQHHAACLLTGEGRTQNVVCPYHGWTYGLNGNLIGTPRCGGIRNFNPNEKGLVPIAVETWGPFVWINFSPSPSPLRESLGTLVNELEEAEFNQLQFYKRIVYEVRCNWKVYVDNYLDGGYHVPILHKTLASQLNLSSYRTEVFDRYSIQRSAGAPSERRIGKEALYAWIYPNFMINRYGVAMDTNFVVPISVDRTLTVFDFFFDRRNPACTEEFIKGSLHTSEEVQQEDIRICESVQKGLGSKAYSQGRYAPSLEQGEYAFHQLLSRELTAKGP